MAGCSRVIGVALVALGCCAVNAAITIEPWVPIFRGVEFTRGEADAEEPRMHKVRAVRVDLTEPAIEFFSTPSNGDGPMETYGQTTTTFVQTYGVAVGVNANFFSPVSTIPNDPRELSGLAISRGVVVSPPESGRPMALITPANVASIVQTAPGNLAPYWTAVAGSDRVLINGVSQLAACETSFCNQNPRTAVGISADGRYFYMVVIDGRQAGWSDGATLFETGEWLKRLGAWNALNLDGGGSTAMAKLENGAAVLLNRPSGGIQRVNGNHLGVFAGALAPVFLTQPQDQTVPVGENATFSVLAGGTTPLHYQWRLNGTNLPGATGSSLTITNPLAGDAGAYSVAVSNLAGVTVSSNAVLAVTIPFSIANLSVTPRPHSAIIRWASHPESISRIEYGIVPETLHSLSVNAIAHTNHAILLVGLAPRTNYTFRIFSDTGFGEVAAGPYTFSTDLTVIVDNPQATYSGNWTLSTSAPDQFGAYMQYTPTVTSSPSATATYAPTIITPGKYDLSIWYSSGANRATEVPVTVLFDGGALTRTVNQTSGGGAWQLLATNLPLASGAAGFALIANHSAEPDRIVIADAMRWSYVIAQDIPPENTVPAWWNDYYFGMELDASLDADLDGYSSYAEYVMGTNPTDANSRLQTSVHHTGAGLELTFAPWHPGRIYELQFTTNLAAGNWRSASVSPAVANGQGTFALTNAPGASQLLYRLAIRLAP